MKAIIALFSNLKDTFAINSLLDVVYSVAPLTIILLILKIAVFRSKFESNKQFVLGLILAIFGLFLFLQGANISIIPLAESVGSELFKLRYQPIVLMVVFLIGFTATLVEPALKVVANQAEEISAGAITNKLLIYLTATGFGVGMVVGVVKIIYNIKIAWILIPLLIIAAILSYFSNSTFTALSFDCASATTGPVNIPVNMMIAMGLSRSIEGVDPLTAGFGLVGLTSLGAALMILLFGVFRV